MQLKSQPLSAGRRAVMDLDSILTHHLFNHFMADIRHITGFMGPVQTSGILHGLREPLELTFSVQ